MRGPALIVGLAAAAFASAACATSGGGPQTRLLVTTDPPGATLFVNGANMGPTPAQVQVTAQESSLALRLEHEGYQDAQVTVTRRAHGKLETSLPLEGEPIDRSSGSTSGAAIGTAVVAAAVTAIDRQREPAGRLDPSAVHIVLVKR